MDQNAKCFITDSVNETSLCFSSPLGGLGVDLKIFKALGSLAKLPGANPVQAPCFEQGYVEEVVPAIYQQVLAYSDLTNPPTRGGEVIPSRSVNTSAPAPKGTCLWNGANPVTPLPWWLCIVTLIMYIVI